jgi:hypothetical protein
VENQDNHGNNQKQVNEPAADAAEQAQKPENGENNSDPKQHGDFLSSDEDVDKTVSSPGPTDRFREILSVLVILCQKARG